MDEGDSDVTVIFESGMGGNVLDWIGVRAALPQDVRTVAYDRAGLGWSDPPRTERSPEVIVDELEATLSALQASRPYILVAHSLGARYARLFALRHPREVIGMVLVDGYHETWDVAIGSEALASFIASRIRMWSGVRVLSRLGIMRILGARATALLGPDLKQMPLDQRARFVALLSQSGALRTAGEELRRGGESNATLATQTFDGLPLRVVSHTIPFPDAEQERAWQDSQAELATRSSGGELVRADGAGHYVMVARPSLVADQIAALLAAGSDGSS